MERASVAFTWRPGILTKGSCVGVSCGLPDLGICTLSVVLRNWGLGVITKGHCLEVSIYKVLGWPLVIVDANGSQASRATTLQWAGICPWCVADRGEYLEELGQGERNVAHGAEAPAMTNRNWLLFCGLRPNLAKKTQNREPARAQLPTTRQGMQRQGENADKGRDYWMKLPLPSRIETRRLPSRQPQRLFLAGRKCWHLLEPSITELVAAKKFELGVARHCLQTNGSAGIFSTLHEHVRSFPSGYGLLLGGCRMDREAPTAI